MFFSLLRQRERTKRDHVARSVSDKIMIPRIFAAGLASLKQVLAMPSAPCSIIGFYTFPSCYRNVIRSKDEDYSSLLSAISSRLGIAQASLTLLSLLLSFRPPSRNLIRVIRSRSRIKSAMRDQALQGRQSIGGGVSPRNEE